MSRQTGLHTSVSRRSFMAASATAATLLLPRELTAASGNSLNNSRTLGQVDTASPEGWRMWHLETAASLRPSAPGAATQAEIDEIVAIQAQATPEAAEAPDPVAMWGTVPASLSWSKLAAELFTEFKIGPGLPQSRTLAILYTAMHDASIAAWDAQLAHSRPGPAATDSRIVPALGVVVDQPSFPSEHAAVAGAAAAVFAYVFVDAEAGRFDQLAIDAAESRMAAGAAFRSDIDAGLDMGKTVAEMAIARARDDGSDATWDPATKPSGPGVWQPTPPMFVDPPGSPMGGSRTPWVMSSGDQFRPAPPPEYGSEAWQAELAQVQHIVANRDFEQNRAAVWWGTSSANLHVSEWAQDLIVRSGTSSPLAAKILADVHVAVDDALIGCWDGKFAYWTSRPITEDPTLVTSVPSPPYPAYPGGYATVVGSGSTVIGHYFPEASVDLEERAWEATCSRLWAGIHYGIDNDAGLLLGRRVGRLIAALDTA